ncbi:hypothetical protein E8L99_15740 [Phreatobacter aquaticus]|uniref:DUF3313 domain-containing protein n=1 Tax=Phreatobacter aquaticus TaxID=2570229 RepID=A0A4D7QJ71_9HYPH|nr:hypothetical protein [Phreatobacter aquaticus]QCK87105.1 hypothetical protein E8L99_15740 [Phreatobacter aquaticus]
MSVAELNTYRVAGVDVVLAPGVNGRTTSFEMAYAQSRGAQTPPASTLPEAQVTSTSRAGPDYFTVVNSPEAQEYYQRRTVEIVRDEMEKRVGHALLGQKPARIHVTVTTLTLPNEAMRILVSQHHLLQATVVLRDAVTGQALVTYPDMRVVIDGGGGLVGTFLVPALVGGPVERLAAELAQGYRNWLLQN